jgi:hypothetical protein
MTIEYLMSLSANWTKRPGIATYPPDVVLSRLLLHCDSLGVLHSHLYVVSHALICRARGTRLGIRGNNRRNKHATVGRYAPVQHIPSWGLSVPRGGAGQT